MSSKLFRKQPLRGVVENGDFKIYTRSMKNICEGVPLSVKFQAKRSYIYSLYIAFT